MTDGTFDERLAEIEKRIDELPVGRQESLKKLVEETRRRHVEIRHAVGEARSALADWRIALKYLVFDLEARLRESAR